MERKKPGNILEKARKEAGITQAEMAARLRICRQTYCRYEHCPETMPLGMAVRFAEVVGRSAVALFLLEISTKSG